MSNRLATRLRPFYTIGVENCQNDGKGVLAVIVITWKSNDNLFIFLFEETHFYKQRIVTVTKYNRP